MRQYEGAVKIDQGQIDAASCSSSTAASPRRSAAAWGCARWIAGNIVHATDTNGLVVITQLQPIAVIFPIPEDSLPTVLEQLGQRRPAAGRGLRPGAADKARHGRASDRRQPDRSHHRHRQAQGDFPNTDNELFPNQFVNARLLVETRRGATVVPTAAIQRGPQGTFVYVVKADRTVAVRPVGVGVTDGDDVSIERGWRRGSWSWSTAPSGCGRSGHRAAERPVNLSRPFILRPVATTLLMVAILLAGALAYRLLPVSALPQVDYPTIQVRTFYPGASPDVMATSVTAPAGAAVRPDARADPDDLDQLRRQLGHHPAVQPRPGPRRGRAGGAGGHQRGASPSCRRICRTRRSTARSTRPMRRS